MTIYSRDGEWWWDGVGWRPVPVPPVRVVRYTNHTFHLLMTIFTCGLWAPIWVIVAIANRNGTV
jgi:hypothetical protein